MANTKKQSDVEKVHGSLTQLVEAATILNNKKLNKRLGKVQKHVTKLLNKSIKSAQPVDPD